MASIKEFYGTDTQLYDSIIKKVNFNLRCCIPGIVQSFDNYRCTAEIQPAVREEIVNEDNSVSYVNLPLLINVPIIFPYAANFGGITFPISQGDEVLVFFSDLSYDNFWKDGGVQNPVEVRRHDLSDGIAIPASISQKNAPFVDENHIEIVCNNCGIILDRELGEIYFFNSEGSCTLSQLKYLIDHIHTAPAGGGETSTPTH